MRKRCETLRIDPRSIIFGSLPIRLALFTPPSCFNMRAWGSFWRFAIFELPIARARAIASGRLMV